MDKGNILIIEDSKVAAELMKDILTSNGYRVSGVISTGEEAVNVALATRPDLVLMDICLEGSLDGIKAFEKIKEKTDIPVLIISSNINEENIARSLHAKPSGYVSKPFTPERLVRKVEMALAGHRLL